MNLELSVWGQGNSEHLRIQNSEVSSPLNLELGIMEIKKMKKWNLSWNQNPDLENQEEVNLPT